MSERLLKIGELAKRSGVPVATIKHYLREGLIKPTKKTGRTMSWYAPTLAPRIRAIKELQQEQFLPLDIIKQSIERDTDAPDSLAAAAAIARVLERHAGPRNRSRDELIQRGVPPQELDWLAAAGIARPGADGKYRGDDLAILQTLGAARRAGLTAEMLPFTILGEYLAAIRALVAVELRLFRDGVLARTKSRDHDRLTTTAAELSERLVVLIRRKLLLPTLQTLLEEDRPDAHPGHRDRAHRLQQHRPPRRRQR